MSRRAIAYLALVVMGLLAVGVVMIETADGRSAAARKASDVGVTRSQQAAGTVPSNPSGPVRQLDSPEELVRVQVVDMNAVPVMGAIVRATDYPGCRLAQALDSSVTNEKGISNLVVRADSVRIEASLREVGFAASAPASVHGAGVVQLRLAPLVPLTIRYRQHSDAPINAVSGCAQWSRLAVETCMEAGGGIHGHSYLPPQESSAILAAFPGGFLAAEAGGGDAGVEEECVLAVHSGHPLVATLAGPSLLPSEGIEITMRDASGTVSLAQGRPGTRVLPCTCRGGSHVLVARVQGSSAAAYDDANVSTVDWSDVACLAFEPADVLSGQVVWPSGAPAQRMHVLVEVQAEQSMLSGYWSLRHKEAITDELGCFLLEGIFGDLQYRVRVEAWQPTQKEYLFETVTASKDQQRFILADDILCHEPSIIGRVIDGQSGLPVAECETSIAIESPLSGYIDRWSEWLTWRNPAGLFEYTDVDESTRYYVRVRWGRSVSVLGPLQPGVGSSCIDLLVGEQAELRVVVHNQVGERQASGIAYLREAAPSNNDNVYQPIRTTELGANGEVRWSGLAPGWYWVGASDASGNWGGALCHAISGGQAHVDLVTGIMTPSCSIVVKRTTGRFQAEDGRPVSLSVRRCGPDLMWRDSVVYTDVPWPVDSDSCEVARIAPGEYQVEVVGEDGRRYRTRTMLSAGSTTVIDI